MVTAVLKRTGNPKSFKCFTEGTHRSRLPEETLAHIEKFFPIFGITRIANVTGLDIIGIPVVMVVRPNSRSLSVTQGKGLSLPAARVSGIMESIEGFHAEALDVPTRLLSYEDLATAYRPVDVRKLSLSRDKPFRPDAKIPWVMGRDLINGDEVWLPYEIVHADYTCPPPFDSGYFISDSNGLASGNCLVEAINHGLCEVIERDALTLWSLKDVEGRNRCSIDLTTVDDPVCAGLINKFREKNIGVAVWDITSDIGVPAYTCKIAQDSNENTGIRPAMGAGCHPGKSIALSRALTEAAQSRLTFISGARDDQLRDIYRKHQSHDVHASWKDEIGSAAGVLDFRDRQDYRTSFLEDDMAWLLGKLRAAGLQEAAFVDLTREEFGISVVKIVVPGLECHTSPEKRIMGARAIEQVARRNAAKERKS